MPKHSLAYFARGIAYERLRKDNQALSDFMAAARLGDQSAQDYLRSQGVKNW
jgi:hypothetical protein